MPQPLEKFYMFPDYQTREVYDNQPGDGADAPPWNGFRKLKTWVDPNPANVMDLGIGIGKIAIYEAAIEVERNGTFAVGPDGHPKVTKMSISLEEAQTLNFLPPGGQVPTESDLGWHPGAKQMIENAQRQQSRPLNLPVGARVRWSPGIQNPIVYLAGEPLPEEQGAAGQAATLGQVLAVANRIAAKVGA